MSIFGYIISSSAVNSWGNVYTENVNAELICKEKTYIWCKCDFIFLFIRLYVDRYFHVLKLCRNIAYFY